MSSNMPIKVGEVEAIFRYPVKSMSSEPLEVADLGWHGLDGDRRLALRRVDDRGGFQDVRRFRPNILVASMRSAPFEEDEWVGGVLTFGETTETAAIGITNYDERCSMVNFDPDSARQTAEGVGRPLFG